MDKHRKNGAGRRVPAMIVVVGMLTVLAGSVQAAEYKGWDLAGFVEALGDFPSDEIDARVLAIFRSAVGGVLSAEKTDTLALACIRRLLGKGHDSELRRYCRKRLAGRGDKAEYTALLKRLEDWR